MSFSNLTSCKPCKVHTESRLSTNVKPYYPTIGLQVVFSPPRQSARHAQTFSKLRQKTFVTKHALQSQSGGHKRLSAQKSAAALRAANSSLKLMPRTIRLGRHSQRPKPSSPFKQHRRPGFPSVFWHSDFSQNAPSLLH